MAAKAQVIDFLLSQVRDSTQSLAGGSATFYAAGTTTPKDVYIDRNKAGIAANPFTLDANGTAQLYGDGIYRVVIKTKAGVTVFDRDNLNYVDYVNSIVTKLEISAAASDIASNIDPGTVELIAIKTDATAHTVTLIPPGGYTINGNPSYVLSNQGETVHLLLSGTVYYSV